MGLIYHRTSDPRLGNVPLTADSFGALSERCFEIGAKPKTLPGLAGRGHKSATIDKVLGLNFKRPFAET